MRLDPERYECTVDGRDITDLVIEELGLRVPGAYDRRTETRLFQVIVSCPGRDKEHEVRVSGKYSR